MLITNIGELITNAPRDAVSVASPGPFEAITDAAIVLDSGLVAWAGPASQAPAADEVVDAAGRAVLPGYVDSHAHLVFAGERSAEFAARMAGVPYSAGGIRSTVAATRAASDEVLRANLARLAGEMLAQGTTTFECKSGYGLSVAGEARSVALAAEVTSEVTYLGAHVVAPEFDGDVAGYVDLVCGDMLAACAPQAKWVDVFCERGAFGADEARAVLRAGETAGLQARIHANQLGPGPGVQVAVEAEAASADHCTFLSDADVDALASSGGTVATLLPGVEFATRQPYPDARRLLAAGVTVAIASDCNPGSCFTSSMAAVRGARGPRDADDHGRGGLGGDGGRSARAAPHRRRASGRGRPGRPGDARRAVALLPRLPARRPAGGRRLEVRRAGDRQRVTGG